MEHWTSHLYFMIDAFALFVPTTLQYNDLYSIEHI